MARTPNTYLVTITCLLVLAASCNICSAIERHHRSNPAAASDRTPDGSFGEKLRALRRLAAQDAKVTRDMIEKLDELDDVELSQLRIPKRSLQQGLAESVPPAYAAGARRHALQADAPAYGARRHAQEVPAYGARRRMQQEVPTYGGRRLA